MTKLCQCISKFEGKLDKVFVRRVFGLGFGDDLNLNLILDTQTGHHLFEVLSGFAVWLIQKKPNFEHDSLLVD